MAIISKPFGVTKKGDAVTMFTMTNKQGASVSVIELGAIITSIIVPDKNGTLADVTLGFDTLDRYEGDHAFMGDIVGRYGNRIAKAKFTLDGVDYNLAVNDNQNHLHGGKEGFNTKTRWRIWLPRCSRRGVRCRSTCIVCPAKAFISILPMERRWCYW